MEPTTYEIIAEVERTHWWYAARRRILFAAVADMPHAVGRMALDVGCGTGANLPIVERCGSPLGCDVSELALAFAKRRGSYQQLHCADVTALPYGDAVFDCVFATDVLEHVDDGAAAREMLRVLRPGGRAVITVPAFRALWGPQDDASHHLRRYTRRTLLAVLADAGYELKYVTYINVALFVPILLVRRLLRLLRLPVRSENTLHPGWLNPILERVFGVESHFVGRVAFPFGVSLLCVALRPVAQRVTHGGG